MFRFGERELKREIARKAMTVSFELLIEAFRRDAIQLREIAIEHDAMSTHDKYAFGDRIRRTHAGFYKVTICDLERAFFGGGSFW